MTLETFPTCETLLFKFFIFSKFNEKKNWKKRKTIK
jgi:hypothetical protein